MAKIKKNKKDNSGIVEIPPYLIRPNPSLSRTDFSDTALVSLADSIRRYGMLQPLAVRVSEKGRYELIAGERRLRAAILLELATVPCVLLSEDDDLECLSVVENIQREELNMFDQARAIRRLCERNGRDKTATAELLSLGESELSRKLRLCEFSRAEMQAIQRLGFSEREAELYLDVPQNLRYYTIKLCAEKGYSRSEIKRLCAALCERKDITPDDLETFAGGLDIKERAREQETGKNAHTEKNGKLSVLLRDLRTFEVSLRKKCDILESAGYSTDIRKAVKDGVTTYTVRVERR